VAAPVIGEMTGMMLSSLISSRSMSMRIEQLSAILGFTLVVTSLLIAAQALMSHFRVHRMCSLIRILLVTVIIALAGAGANFAQVEISAISGDLVLGVIMGGAIAGMVGALGAYFSSKIEKLHRRNLVILASVILVMGCVFIAI
jgi:hypothetical protein